MEKCKCNGTGCGKAHGQPLFDEGVAGCPNPKWHNKTQLCRQCWGRRNYNAIDKMAVGRAKRIERLRAIAAERQRAINKLNQPDLPLEG